MIAREHFREAMAAFMIHRDAVSNALHEYRSTVSQYGSRYAPDYARQMIAEAKAEASSKIARADNAMHDAITSIVKNMRYEMNTVITTAPGVQFLSAIAFYDRPGVKMAECEVRAFAERSAHSYAELRYLQSVAKGSGFKVSIPSVTDLEADIKRIECGAWIPSMYTPLEYVKEASEVLGEIPQFRKDGSVWIRNNKADAVYLATVNHTRERLIADLDAVIPEKWNHAQPIEVKQINGEDNSPEAGEAIEGAEKGSTDFEKKSRTEYAENLPITPEDDPNAAAIIAQNEAAAKQSREILSKYLGR